PVLDSGNGARLPAKGGDRRRAAGTRLGNRLRDITAADRPLTTRWGSRPTKRSCCHGRSGPTIRVVWGGSSAGRALQSHCRGREFKSLPLHIPAPRGDTAGGRVISRNGSFYPGRK